MTQINTPELLEISLRMPKKELDEWIIQIGRRIHRLRGEIQAAVFNGRPISPQDQADLAITEVLRERLRSSAYLIPSGDRYQEPESDYKES